MRSADIFACSMWVLKCWRDLLVYKTNGIKPLFISKIVLFNFTRYTQSDMNLRTCTMALWPKQNQPTFKKNMMKLWINLFTHNLHFKNTILYLPTLRKKSNSLNLFAIVHVLKLVGTSAKNFICPYTWIFWSDWADCLKKKIPKPFQQLTLHCAEFRSL